MAKPVLFVCVENAGRSQMAEAFFRKHAGGRLDAASAGTAPAAAVNPIVADAMAEVGIDIKDRQPKTITQDMIKCSTVVSMGCIDHDACPALLFNDAADWQIPDPKGKSRDDVRKIRDQIESKVKELVCSLDKK